jgi:hypothetical protein
VQNVGFVPANNAEHGTLGGMSNSSDKLCNDVDSSTQPLKITQDHKQTNKHKRITKAPSQDLMIFYGHNIPYRRVNVHICKLTYSSTSEC